MLALPLEYALIEFNKAIALLEQLDDKEMIDELRRQIKKVELELKLEESKNILVERRKNN